MSKTLSKMTKAEARVAIAKDALAQLRANKYLAEEGAYVSFTNSLPINEDDEKSMDQQLCKLLPKAGSCTVCARGALFLSTIRKFNHFTVADLLENGGDATCAIHDTLRPVEDRYFTNHQLALIEHAFEGQEIGNITFSLCSEEMENCELFFKHYDCDDDLRLENILKNIIRNKGTFVPPNIKKAIEQA
jgi:hypothetical protein